MLISFRTFTMITTLFLYNECLNGFEMTGRSKLFNDNDQKLCPFIQQDFMFS
jgi:hypothetical protein